MRRVVWTELAISQAERIRQYVAKDRPSAAAHLIERLYRSTAVLAASADIGRPVSKAYRELVVVRPYVIRYRVTDAEILIIQVRHGARRLN